jgi:mRNA (guanine-N7-)-methyltransferase
MHYAFESEEKVKMMLRNVAGSLKKGGRFIGVVPNSDALASRVVEWHKKQNQRALAANGETSQEKDEPSQDSEEAPKEELGPLQDSGKAPKENHEASPDRRDAPKHKRNPSENDDETPKKRRKIEENDQSPEEPSAPEWGNSIYRVRFPIDTDRPTAPDGTFRPPFSWKYMYWMDEAVDVPEYVVPWEAFRALAEGFNLEQRYRKPFLDIWASEKDDRDLAPLSLRMGVRKYEGGPLEITEEEREAVSFYHAFCFVKV